MASSSAPESGIASLSIADDPHTDAVSQITHMLGSVWQVRIRDDARTFTGNFMAVDRQKNVILDGATEEAPGRKTRKIGLIMLPGERIISVKMDRKSYIT
ncbi:hypothetical protein EMMF5_002879 [Cystobasidiomycetes sp. EMM_F5]